MKLHKNMSVQLVVKAVGAVAAAVTLTGCWAHDAANYDRVAFGAGNAVQHNLELQTVNPSSDAQYDVDGLGQNGVQAVAESE